jgi:hypothetical protein
MRYMSTLKGKLKVNYQDEYQVIHPESDVAQITDFAEGVRNVIPIPTHKVNTTYALGDIVYANNLPSWAYLECTTAGTTASTEPVGINTNVVIDTQITDGTVIWTVRKQGTPVASILRSLINTGIAQDQIPYGSGANSFAVTALTTLARTLLGQTTAAGMRETIDSAESSHSHSVGDITNFASEVIDAIGDETLSALGVHYSMTTNSYICFGELFGGLILQWGQFIINMPLSGKVIDPCGTYKVLFPITHRNGRIVYLAHHGGTYVGIIYQLYTGTDMDYYGQAGFDAIISSVYLPGVQYTALSPTSRYIHFYSVGW